nr:ORF1 [Torque teno virus 8]
MWWTWWKRRRWRPQRRWRRRRPRRAAYRRRLRAARPYRRRRVRRWRRRRRRGWARRRYLRKRRFLKRRKKINITQWNPTVVKKCVITGYVPLLICGTGTTGTTYRNYARHITDNNKYDAFGGGISTLQFNLSWLYEEYCKHRNRWSKTNEGLELVRYKGCKFTLYRHPTCDYFVKYNRKLPFQDSQLTGPSLHPSLLMIQKKRKIVPGFKTKPKGRSTKKLIIKPPTLYTDKWYFMRDFCKVPLAYLGVSLGNLRFPFCRPQTDNPCIYFQVLSKFYNPMLSIQEPHLKQNYEYLIQYLNSHWHEDMKKGTMGNYQETDRLGVVFNTFKTEEHIKDPPIGENKEAVTKPYSYSTVTSLWGDYVYKKSIIQAFNDNASKYYDSRKGTQFTASKYLNHKTGLYSSIFLSRQRLSPDFTGFYTEVIYNPANDKGLGNKVWIDPCSKQDSYWRENVESTVPIVDLPLYMAFLGYSDYCQKKLISPGIDKEVRVTIISPYTQPPLTDKTNTDMGFVPFDYNFGDGKMPDGEGYIPIAYRFRWYPCMFHQKNFMNDMVQCGPFAYGGEEKSVVVTAKYKFNFLFGGNPIQQQTIKDPCVQSTFPFPEPGGKPATVQIENPKFLHEGYFFRAWDLRRGFFGERAVKRMSEKPITTDFLTGPPKRSKLEVPAIASADSYFREQKWSPWSESEQTQTETSSQSEGEETETTQYLKQQLKQQLREQKSIKQKLSTLVKQLVKTQFHLHAPIIP